MVGLFFATFGAVFVAEIVGDKLLYTTGVLATRYRSLPVICGAVLAFMAKMGVAVAIGGAVAHLPPVLLALVTSASFLGVAYMLWRTPDNLPPARIEHQLAPKVVLVSFAAIFFSEWGDVGQVTTAAMAARYSSPSIVWLGAVAAMATKGILAAFLGAGIRRWIHERVSPKAVRYSATATLLLLGLLSALETLTRTH